MSDRRAYYHTTEQISILAYHGEGEGDVRGYNLLHLSNCMRIRPEWVMATAGLFLHPKPRPHPAVLRSRAKPCGCRGSPVVEYR